MADDFLILKNSERDGVIAWTPHHVNVEKLKLACKHVLWVLDGDHELGQEPGGFTRDLILLMCHADDDNKRRLAFVYGELMSVVDAYKTTDVGLEIIRLTAKDPHGSLPNLGFSPKGN